MQGYERTSGRVLYSKWPHKPHACGLWPEGTRLKIEHEKAARSLVSHRVSFSERYQLDVFCLKPSSNNAPEQMHPRWINKTLFAHLKWKVWVCFGGTKCIEFHHNTPPATLSQWLCSPLLLMQRRITQYLETATSCTPQRQSAALQCLHTAPTLCTLWCELGRNKTNLVEGESIALSLLTSLKKNLSFLFLQTSVCAQPRYDWGDDQQHPHGGHEAQPQQGQTHLPGRMHKSSPIAC